MAIRFGEHEGKVINNALADVSPYKLKAVCNCQWEALAIDRFAAIQFLRTHLARNGTPADKLPVGAPDGK